MTALSKRRAVPSWIFVALSLTACQVADAPQQAGAAGPEVTYRYTLYDHCGLNTVPILFDGSEWWFGPADKGRHPKGFGDPDDHGTIRLQSHDVAIYRSEGGTERRVTRGDPISPSPTGYVIGCI